MIQVGNVKIGEGSPKICVPIVEQSQEALLEMAEEIYAGSADFAEWRVDYFENCHDAEAVVQTASLLKSVLADKPLLVTFRTSDEGGEEKISYEEYASLLKKVALSGNADMIDVEVYRDKDIESLIKELQKNVIVVGSYHDFEKTPSTDEIVERIAYMDNVGADIPKIAAMPHDASDVIRLLDATCKASKICEKKNKPVITMSMSKLGYISRIAGELTGSAVTFGAAGKESAPGQIDAGRLKEVLKLIQM